MNFAEYIWIDGADPVAGLRSKTRIVNVSDNNPRPRDFPQWSFDGSSTNQADGGDSDCLLNPVNVVRDPFRGNGAWLVLCEVQSADGSIHGSNTRSALRQVLSSGAEALDAWIGFEQEYTLFVDGRPMGFPKDGYPEPQGPYYCGSGADTSFGRSVVEDHAKACVDAGLMFYGLNAEVMPGQWEFQIGYRGMDADDASLINVADHLWIARWLLSRVAEEKGVAVSFDNKPVKGDWNGAGMHTNFSTFATRDRNSGRESIRTIIDALSQKHAEHIAIYGDRLGERLTGAHETCSIEEFRAGAADRGASIRIPRSVETDGHGYLEDRRPGANADPYLVAARIAATVSDVDDSVLEKFTPQHALSLKVVA